MDAFERNFEDRYANPRANLFQLIQQSSSYNPEIIRIMYECLKDYPDLTQHGSVLWALMVKTQGVKYGVSGLHLKPYLQYYYHFLVTASQRPNIQRSLDLNNLAFLTAVAAFGYHRGCQEFDTAFANRDINLINQAIVDRQAFLTFFWAGNEDNFSFLHAWQLIDRMWDLWDANPIRIHGFMTPALSEQILKRRLNVQGAFLLRFSSRGGLAVDYVRGNKVDKTHWKSGGLENSTNLKSKLYDKSRDGPYLLELVDSRSDPLHTSFTINKNDVFPVNALDNGYINTEAAGSGYVNVVDDISNDFPMMTGYVNMEDKFA